MKLDSNLAFACVLNDWKRIPFKASYALTGMIDLPIKLHLARKKRFLDNLALSVYAIYDNKGDKGDLYIFDNSEGIRDEIFKKLGDSD